MDTVPMLAVVVVIFVGMWSGGCAERRKPGDTAPVLLQEIDRVELLYSEDGFREAMLVEVLGVGLNTPEAETYRFDVGIVDTLPLGETLLFPTENPLAVYTFYGREYALPWLLEEAGETKRLRFELSDVPAIDLDQAVTCTVSDQCGGACSVCFQYSTTWRGEQGEWGDLAFVTSKSSIPIGRATNVDVLISVKTGILRDAVCSIIIPVRVRGARIGLRDAPQEMTVQRHDRWLQLTGEVKGGVDTYSVSIAVEPSLPGTVAVRDFVVVRGNLPGLIASPAAVVTDREVTRTTGTEIYHRGDLHITAMQAD
ncbi:hypothetical protein AMJ71_02180 [candidate division TA06 bacterium SM1_40]|uniref:Uncharacterized protein n=3 Tax=Bacteria division TA06 TaxID=1156500 RepID=A0A0S8JPM7_UNCT6|nr:MAG: hypothetical protein AMJ82_04995 [candidate division TA06 bacterium SM23_40]KPL10717.1 MAG: hypothetical protein AMJ71_02180 [candidate division TA06 bacterium SM1_40]